MNAWLDNLLNFDELIQLFRIFLALLLGAMIGFEREKYGRPAGLRTHILVCVASSLAMLISMFGFKEADEARLAAQVISGIGFIGAGTIIRGDKDITGITTAATIFICAIIGLSVGNGYYFGAILTTITTLIVLSLFTKIEAKLTLNRKFKSTLSVIVNYDKNYSSKLKNILDEANVVVTSLEYKNTTLDGEKVIRTTIVFGKHTKTDVINDLILKISEEFTTIQCKIVNDSYDTSNKHIN